MNTKLLKINLGATRESQRQQGYFDGRFVERTIASKRNYTRKQKHKNKSEE